MIRTLTTLVTSVALLAVATQGTTQVVGGGNFTTCRYCTQVNETPPCAVPPGTTLPYVDAQCGSEDWYNPLGCKDFIIRTHTCPSGVTYRTTVEVFHPRWFSITSTSAIEAACQQ
jgi:hypothetical protein